MDFEAVSSLAPHKSIHLSRASVISGMADRGMGIRLFHSKDSLQQIFEEWEEEDDEENPSDTAVVTSQLRHFVIQVRSLLV